MDWLLLIATLPGQAGSLRLRLWRQVKGMGAANLRDGVYLLPQREGVQAPLLGLSEELTAAGGSAWLLQVPAQSEATETAWRSLFDRSEAYRQWRAVLTTVADPALPATEAEARRRLRQARKELDAIAATDYFPGAGLDDARQACADAERRLTRHYTPDEPEVAGGSLPRLDARKYQGRQWATRARLWVDRVASAWLISRFIDRRARFLWLRDVADCPDSALGFDFDGAAFTHVGNRVTFETLLASFGLDADVGLARLGSMVHGLDVGEGVGAEGQGFEAILEGARQRCADDDELLQAMGSVLDSLHVYFTQVK